MSFHVIDGDGIVDRDDMEIAGGSFTPITVELSDNIADAGSPTINVNFSYNTSTLRIWTKDASASRSLGSVTAISLGLSPGGTVTLYVEALDGSASTLPIDLTTSVVGSIWTGSLTDKVHVQPVVLEMGLDVNRDNTIDYSVDDATSSDSPFRFWLNDDADRFVDNPAVFEPGDETDVQVGVDGVTSDSSNTTIEFKRDLEDFAAGLIRFSPTLIDLSDQVSIEFTDVQSGDPSIRMWQTQMPGLVVNQHVRDGTTADAIVTSQGDSSHFRRIDSHGPFTLSMEDFKEFLSFTTTPGQIAPMQVPFMFEAITAGEGALSIKFLKSGQTLGESKVHLDLLPITELYEHHTVAYGVGLNADKTDWGDPKVIPIPTQANLVSGGDIEFSDRTDDYILFVHGWRMKDSERRSFAETAFKRLWWQGYNGDFGLFSWPTEWINLDGGASGNAYRAAMDSGNFNRSEEIAWHSAPALHNLLVDLRQEHGGNVSMFAHSMGNIVASEALRIAGNNQVVNAYVASQSAVSAHFYDSTVLPDMSDPLEVDYLGFEGEIGGLSPRFHGIDQAAGKVVNFYNPADYALDSWADFNNPFKPYMRSNGQVALVKLEGFYDSHYERYWDQASSSYRMFRHDGNQFTELHMPDNDYEIFSHVIRSQSLTVGATPDVSGPFSLADQVNLDGATFQFGGDGVGHSAQFLSTNMKRQAYWSSLLEAFGMAAT